MAFDQPPINLAVEGPTDEIVLRHILQYVDIGKKSILIRARKGKAHLLKNLDGFNNAAQYGHRWLVVVDLDQDADCAPTFMKTILSSPAEGMLLRIPVRAIESWLLADRDQFAQFLGIAAANIPLDPELEDHPKRTVINLVSQKCRKTRLREDMLPVPNSGRAVGPGYSSQMERFVTNYWRPEIAAENSDSLRRCIAALQNWKLIGA
ncbi:MAG: DUF4276 family protein [Anaerolineae bacterium]|nr:DUF4276 family protein [Anaerolineae bacterium]